MSGAMQLFHLAILPHFSRIYYWRATWVTNVSVWLLRSILKRTTSTSLHFTRANDMVSKPNFPDRTPLVPRGIKGRGHCPFRPLNLPPHNCPLHNCLLDFVQQKSLTCRCHGPIPTPQPIPHLRLTKPFLTIYIHSNRYPFGV